MDKINFSEIAVRYERDAKVQKSAGEMLINLIRIGEGCDILDIGCGTGELTRKLRNMTRGKVVGLDFSKGMLAEAQQKSIGLDITFELKNAEELDYKDSFDIVFANSSFQWFKNPQRVLRNCYRALRKTGRMGIQAPAKRVYCPNFIRAIEKVMTDPRTKEIFAHFNSPWFFLETAEDYESFFKRAGFRVLFSRLAEIRSLYTPREAFKIFESGAAAGYLNQDSYTIGINEVYIENFRQIMKEVLQHHANEDGLLELVFYRVYVVADKG